MRLSPRSAIGAALAACLALTASAGAEEARFAGSFTWRSELADFGGFSGLELSEDGTRFTAISDRTRIVTGRIERAGGKITGVVPDGPLRLLRGTNGEQQPLNLGDSEGLAIGADGRIYVSFEGVGRVAAYDTPDLAIALPRPEAFDRLQSNSGLEALAIDAKGNLYALPERSGDLTRPFPVWRFDGTRWGTAFHIPRRGGFLPVGADFGPAGRFYVLERVFTGYAFRSRVRRFTLEQGQVIQEETLFQSVPLRHDNLEGLSVWRDGDGAIRLTMISDDNFNGLQRTELVEYTVPVPLASRRADP